MNVWRRGGVGKEWVLIRLDSQMTFSLILSIMGSVKRIIHFMFCDVVLNVVAVATYRT